MTDIELLPLPEPWGWARANNGMIEVSHGPECPHNRAGGYATPWGAMYGGDVLQDHARANVAHATAAKDAEIEALRAENKGHGIAIQQLSDRAERLAEALRWYVENDDTNEGQEGNEYWLAGRDRAIAVLRDHDKEVGNG